MILAVFLAIGESWEDFIAKGQDSLFIQNNLKYYSHNFEQVWVFSYGAYAGQVLPNVSIVPNKYNIHRYIYAWVMPFMCSKYIRRSSIIRCMQLTGAIPGFIAKIFFQKKIVANYGYDYVQMAKVERKKIHSYFFKLLELLLLPSIDRIIITNSLLLKSFQKIYANKITLIPNGINTDVFLPKRVPQKYDILYVGRLERQKNLGLLLTAVQKYGFKLRLLFIGTGTLKSFLVEKAQQSKIHLEIIDKVPNGKLPHFYNQAKIFILPSLIEGHPKVLLEAMSCGRAVIGTKVAGIQDLIQHNKNGLLADLSPEALAFEMRRLFKSKELAKKIGTNARDTVIKKYSSEHTWTKEIRLLKSLSS